MGLRTRGKKVTALEIAERIKERSPKDISVEDFLITFFHECFMHGIEHERSKQKDPSKYELFGYYWNFQGMEDGIIKVEDLKKDPEGIVEPGWVPLYVENSKWA